MILLTILADQIYSNYILRPLSIIIRTKLIGNKFPKLTIYKEVKTSTSDFQHLDLSIHKMVETIETTFPKRAGVYIKRVARADDPYLYPAIKN
jgi:two-component system sensor histidine kinase ArlS